MTDPTEDRRSTYNKLTEYRRLTWTRAVAVAVTVMTWALFLMLVQPSRNRYEENLREQLRIAFFVLGVLAVLWTRSVIRRRHTVGADLYAVEALPPSSPWPTIAASIAVAVIGAATTVLTQRGG